MSVFGKPLAVALGAVALSGTALVPFAYALGSTAHAQEIISQPAPFAVSLPQPETGLQSVAEEVATPPADTATAAPASTLVDAELTCLAKIVVHESGNQSRTGQLAVAQVVMNRVNSGRFARTICGVAMQRGQFFNVHAYNPAHDARWRLALEVSREARDGTAAPVIGGALFFHAAYAAPFRGLTRVGRIGDHVFYR